MDTPWGYDLHMGKRGFAPRLELDDWTPDDERQAWELVRALVDAGCPAGKATRIVLALERLRDTGDDGLWSSERSNYRVELLKLGDTPPWRGKPNEHMVGYIGSAIDIRRRRRCGRPGPAGVVKLAA